MYSKRLFTASAVKWQRRVKKPKAKPAFFCVFSVDGHFFGPPKKSEPSDLRPLGKIRSSGPPKGQVPIYLALNIKYWAYISGPPMDLRLLGKNGPPALRRAKCPSISYWILSIEHILPAIRPPASRKFRALRPPTLLRPLGNIWALRRPALRPPEGQVPIYGCFYSL